MAETTPIAIVGISVQLPGGGTSDDSDYSTLWDFLLKGGKAYEPLEKIFPDLARDGEHANLPLSGCFLKNATAFDNVSFAISTRDARVIPNSARRLLDMSFLALQDAGINTKGQRIGGFMCGNRDIIGQDEIDTDGSFSWMMCGMANRASYALDLTGPSVYLDTACSSSLTGFHLAVNAIEKGDCSAAIVGAAQTNRDMREWKAYAQGGVLSPDGMCKPMDDTADGFGRGEGVVVVVLKRLDLAIQDNDHIYCVVAGSSINATGSQMPLNVPNAVAQQKCIIEAYNRAGLSFDMADYVELHATGTSVGDPIEANMAGSLFARERDAKFGSIKGNIGHLEVTAFLASVAKACLMFEHGIIPPTVNFAKPSVGIRWGEFQGTVPVEPVALGNRTGQPIISMTSAGLGGSTGHVVLRAAPTVTSQVTTVTSTITTDVPVLFIVGGLSPNAANSLAEIASKLGPDDLRKFAVTLARRARQVPWRTFFIVSPSQELVLAPPSLVPRQESPLVFVFSGQGPQHYAMGRQLFAESPVFRATILELDAVYQRVEGVSLVESTGLFDSSSSHPAVTLDETAWPVVITLSALAMIQIAMFDLLTSLGVVPDMILGHSAGETIALYASGAGSKEMALEIAIARGKAMAILEERDLGMAALACSSEHAIEMASQVLEDGTGVLEVSCFNAPQSVVLSGDISQLDKVVALAKSRSIFAQRLRTKIPNHSSFMDLIKDDYTTRMADIFSRYPGPHVPRIPVFSSCRRGELVADFTSEYFWENCRNEVLFSDAVTKLLDSHPIPIFVEICCHPVLASSLSAHGIPEERSLCPMRRSSANKPALAFGEMTLFLETLGRLSLLGINSIDLTPLYGRGASPTESKLVEHPLARRQISPAKLRGPSRLQGALRAGPLTSARLSMNKTTHPDLAEHVINGEPILPATGFIEILLEAGASFLWDVEFLSILSLASDSPQEIEVQKANSAWSIRTGSGSLGREHARGCMDDSQPPRPPSKIELGSIWQRLPALNMKGFYSSLQPMASYGPRFQRVVRCHGGPAEVIAEISGPTSDELAQGHLLHPVLMDSCLHALLHPDVTRQNSKSVIYLPSRLGYLTFHRRTPALGNWFAHMTLKHWTPDTLVYDMTVTDSLGVALCELRSFALKKFTSVEPLSVKRRFDLVLQPVIAPVDLPHFDSSFPDREDKAQAITLNKILDSMAVDMIRKSLGQDVVVGDSPSRQRYLETAKRVSAGETTVDVDPLVVQALRERWPNHFEITERVAAVHPSVFESPTHAVNALYSDDLMAKFYSKDSQTSDVCIEATKAFGDVLSALNKAGKKVIKILEVGAGTGLLTHHLVAELRENKDVMAEYTVTDISYALVSDLVRHIDFTPVIPKAYDISKDPQAQGISLEAYDIVVSLHVLHAAPDLHESLASLKTLLVPGGSLLTVELDGTAWGAYPGSVWMDCIFGCFSEWFGYADGRKHCTLSPAAWTDQLEASGFTNVQTCTESNGGRDFYFVAQKPTARLPDPEVPVDSADVYLYEFGKEIELQTWLRAHDREAPTTLYIAAMQGRDGDAAVGLCVILRKELLLWNIRLCIFEAGADIVPVLAKNKWVFESGEDTVFFDRDGSHVPRLALGRSPPKSSPQSALTVRVSQWAGMSSSFDGFVGHVESPSHPNFPRDSLVGGVAVKVAADEVTVSVDSVGLVLGPVQAPILDLAKDILGSVVASFIAEDSARSKRVLVALRDAELTCDVQKRVAAGMGRFKLVHADSSDVDSFQCVDILLCDSETYSKNPHLRRWIARDGKLIVWDSLLKQSRQQDPSFVQRAIVELGYGQINLVPMLPSPPSNPLRCASPPFRADGAYILLGGIGGLGVDLAVWMYQHGAKHLVLTSRRGIASLDPVDDAITLAKISYLSGLEDLQLQLEACDGTRSDQMGNMVRRLSKSAPIAGCFLMALVLSDAVFFEQTRATLDAVYDSKVKMLEVFAAEADIASLDFFVALSSISGLVGIAGQANYASACTTVDGILAGYKNAFSLITPGISDVGFLDRASSKHIARKDRFGSITAQTLWTYLEDGLRKLDDAAFNQYIPDLDWDSLETHLTLPGTCRHLMSPIRKSGGEFIVAGAGVAQEQAAPNILHHILELLEVPAEEFDADQPLSVYGLDSITAAKVATELRPYAAVSQMQLLGGATWSDVLAIMKATAEANPSMNAILFEILGVSAEEFSADLPLASYGLDSLGASRLATALQPFIVVTQMQLMGQSSWNEILRSGDRSMQTTSSSGSAECIVEIRGGEGTPLIVLCGANGSAALFFGLRDTFEGPLWAIQITDSTPLESMPTLVAYWRTQICAKRPNGPYRFAAYSASVVPSVSLVKLFEDAGEEVLQLTFVDNSPTVWIHEACETILRKQSAADFRTLSDELVLDMLRNDPSTSPTSLAAYEAAIEDRAYTPSGPRTELTISRIILTLTFEFLEGFYPVSDDRSYATFIGPFEEWLFSLKAPIAVILAEFGMLLSTPCRGWPDLGASRFPGSPVKENSIPGVGHYSMFRHETVARLLSEY